VTIRPESFPETSLTLLGKLCDGNQGWQEFYERYAPAVYRVARLRGLDADDAEDVLQQVMLSISGHIASFRYDRDRGRFRTWVRRITENQIINLGRRRRPPTCDPQQFDAQTAEGLGPDELWAEQWQLQDMWYCLDRLAADITPRRMQAFRMYVLEGQPAEEVAKALDMTVGWVYVTRNQVLNMLRQRMEALGSESKP
jgi:RNA polymerase sigma-70 factor, ECF subfamily